MKNMSWKYTPSEHAKIWGKATEKVVSSLDKRDWSIANRIFAEEHNWLLKGLTEEKMGDQKSLAPMLISWLLACFMKENTPLVPWFLKKHGKLLTQEETEVLKAAHESWFGAFKVKTHEGGRLVLTDTAGKDFLVELVDMQPLTPGTAVITRIMSKGPGRWFAPGQFAVQENDSMYEQLAAHRRFTGSWHRYLYGFFKYLWKGEGLAEKTADRHMENATLLTMFLDDEVTVDSFKKITKPMLKSRFKSFCQNYIHPKPDMDKVYYSLQKFFNYLAKEKGEENPEVLDWLGARI